MSIESVRSGMRVIADLYQEGNEAPGSYDCYFIESNLFALESVDREPKSVSPNIGDARSP